jgi:carbamoyltransferase
MKFIRKKLKYKKDVFFVEHHMAHAAGSFLISPFKKAAILTVDGVGEWTTTGLGFGEDNKISLKKEIVFPHSLGLLYSAITAYLGFSVNNSEYKVMGLSPYGDMNKGTNPYYEKFKKIIDVKEDGSYKFDMTYFTYHYKNKMPSKKLFKLFGGPIRKPESEITGRHQDIAAALQLMTEEIMTKMLNHLYKETHCENLVLAGGVGLNSVCNGKILKKTPFKNFWSQPDPGDGGTSIGAAAFLYYSVLNNKRGYIMNDAYLGPEYNNLEIKKYLEKNDINFSEFENEKELVKKVAGLIGKDNVVGWFCGRMEWGPRALGSRSILSNAANPKMQEILNLKVKHREKFRPFAPVVCCDDAEKYFECDTPIPKPTDFMLMVYPIIKEWHKKIPSVTHVDGSGRLQTIRRNQNPLYYDLLKEFGKISGVPILINTSFNIRGEPIVCAPEDAYRCMMGTEIDYLVMGKFLIKRAENSRDIWDSEKNARD